MIRLEREGRVFVAHMEAGENRFHPDMIGAWNDMLDQVEAAPGAKALVTTGSGKFYSNGLDLEWMMGPGRSQVTEYLRRVLAIYGRVLTFPAITVAAVNGHAFGAGGQVALAHDFRWMRADRGFFCMPEVDMRAPLHPGMTAILQARLPRQTVHEVIATGRRYGGEDARVAGIADRALPEAELLPGAVAFAETLAEKAHPVLSRLKRDLYPQVLAAFEAELEEVQP